MARLRLLLGIAALLLLGAFALAGSLLFKTAKGFGGGGKGVKDLFPAVINPRGQFPGQGRVNVLLIGTDYDYVWTKRDPRKSGWRTNKNTRSDTIAMVSLDLDHQKVSMLSVPRDTLVRAPESLGSNKMVEGKINGTYRRGGYPLLAQTVGNLLGVKPDYYVAVKPDALKNIVDVLGGVEVETIDAFKYNDWTARLFVDMPKGKQVINGEQAIGYARFREPDIYKRNPDHSPIPVPGSHTQFLLKPRHEIEHSLEEGEPRRMARQQQLIRAMTAKAQNPQNLMQIDKIINVALDQVDTNLTRTQILALVTMFRTIKSDQMESGTLKGEGVKSNLYFFHPDEEKMKELVDWLLRGDEKAANHLTVVAVQNGTDVPGAANHVAETLREQGYDVQSVGNANRGEGGHEIDKTRILYHVASVAHRAETIEKTIGGGTLIKEPKPDQTGVEGFDDDPVDITVVVGKDIGVANEKKAP
jgi:LCP family protein required for cell wall assembly